MKVPINEYHFLLVKAEICFGPLTVECLTKSLLLKLVHRKYWLVQLV